MLKQKSLQVGGFFAVIKLLKTKLRMLAHPK